MDQISLIYATVAALIIAVLLQLFYIASRPTKKPVTPTKKEEKKEEKPKMSEEVKSEEKHPVFLNRERQKVPLIKKIELSHDTHLYRFGLPTPDTVLGLPIGKHFKLFCPNVVGVEPGKWNGRDDPEAGKDEIQRSYTPTSSDDDKGHFDLVVKVYSAGVVERFPDGGKASQYLNSLSIGDEITISGPFGLIEYKGNGVLERARKQFNATHIGMISGGTGITPMLQIINAVLKNPNDPTKLSLLFANQTEADILVRDILEQLVAEHADRFSIWYTLDRPPTVGWEYSTGFINQKMISDHLPAPGENTAILMCGPPPMIEFACKPNLKAAGHDEKAFFVF